MEINNQINQYRPLFTKDSLVRTVQNGSETIYLYQGRGLVPDSRTDKYLDYAPVKTLELPNGYESATASAFCEGCTLYKYPDKQMSIITNSQGEVVRITEYLNSSNTNWWYIVLIIIPPLIIWLILKKIKLR